MIRREQAIRPLLLLEINEVPWRLVDRFMGHPELPNVTAFFRRSETYTTQSDDVGELSPWITWPSLHRGINNTKHNIRNLGQDPASFRGTPIWKDYRDRGYTVGICGSLQSWPPEDPGPGGFYVPDTFAHDDRCIPSYVEPFQRFNLSQVNQNDRVVKRRSLLSWSTLALLISVPRLGIRRRTIQQAVGQLILERRDAAAIARRPVFQAVLLWDVFRHLYRSDSPPAIATFFTNHVAGIMHRYWHDTFPEDFDPSTLVQARPHAETMLFALSVLDFILMEAMQLAQRNRELLLVVASSMGQAAIHRTEHQGYAASIRQVGQLMSSLAISKGAYKPLMAMVPQAALEARDEKARAAIRAALECCESASGMKMFSVDAVGLSVTVSIVTPGREDIRHGGLYVIFSGQKRRFVSWAEAGVEMYQVEAGTGYHIPDGVLAIYGSGIVPSNARTAIRLTSVKAFLSRLCRLDEGPSCTAEVARFDSRGTPSVPRAH